ncbi:MAG: GxxExxY protein [Flavobacteriales bacterium]|nr:GxxExxY protein [Flavobacteriales bacterium]
MGSPEQIYPHSQETERIIKAAFEVHNNLGAGFLEIVYKDALELEFKERKIFYEREKQYPVNYKGTILHHSFFADFVIFEKVILEVKAKSGFARSDMSQTLNYLKCSGCKVGLVINFGTSSVEIKRVVF